MRALLAMALEIGLPFLVFLCAALLILWRERRGDRGAALRPWIQAFIAIALLTSFGLAFIGRNAWPFSKWPLVAGRVGETVEHPRFLAVDRSGVEHDVDWRAWQPIAVDELTGWSDSQLPRLAPDARRRALLYLLELAERGRRRALAGESPGNFDRYLGPFTAPQFLLHPKRWEGAGSVPGQEFVGLRLYHERWNVEQRYREGEGVVTRELQHEVFIP